MRYAVDERIDMKSFDGDMILLYAAFPLYPKGDAPQAYVDFDSVWGEPVKDSSADVVARSRPSEVTNEQTNQKNAEGSRPSPWVESSSLSQIPRGVVFISGRAVIKDEFRRLKVLWPGVSCFPVAGPCGAAGKLAFDDYVKFGLQGLENERANALFAGEVMDAVAGSANQGYSEVGRRCNQMTAKSPLGGRSKFLLRSAGNSKCRAVNRNSKKCYFVALNKRSE